MRAGTAKVDITPKTNIWMEGMVRRHKSLGVHDPLFARARGLIEPIIKAANSRQKE